MDNDLIVLSGYDRAVGIFIDGAPNNCAALLLAKRGYIRAASAEADPQGCSASDYHIFLLPFLTYRTTPVSTSLWNWK